MIKQQLAVCFQPFLRSIVQSERIHWESQQSSLISHSLCLTSVLICYDRALSTTPAGPVNGYCFARCSINDRRAGGGRLMRRMMLLLMLMLVGLASLPGAAHRIISVSPDC